MGQTLASARKSTADGGGRLAYNEVNENLLNKLMDWATSYAGAHPGEAKLKFKAPLSWPTTLKVEDFSGGAFEQRGDDMVSTETIGSENLPVIRLHKDSDGVYKMSVLTIADLVQILNISGNRKLDETRRCLEANHDPLANMAGDRFASVSGEDLSAYRYMEEIMKSPREESDEVEEKKMLLRLVMHVKKLDEDLLAFYADAISKTLRLTAQAVEQDVNLIKEFCGEDEEAHVLEDICFTHEHKFNDNKRSPPWRQVFGDISYIEVKPHDEDPFFVTASETGYFINKGWVKEKNDLDYDRNSETFSNLVELIKTRSQKFTELINRQTWDKYTKAKKTRKHHKAHVISHGWGKNKK